MKFNKKILLILIISSVLMGCTAPKAKPCDDSLMSSFMGLIGFSVCGSKQEINPYF